MHAQKKKHSGSTQDSKLPKKDKLQVEALLFSSGRTMTEEQISTLAKLDPVLVRHALTELQKDYDGRESALCIFNDPTGWKMMVREAYVPTVKNIVADTELTRACMETLAVIAYKYPKVMQSEVINMRGGGAYDHMAELEKLGFITRTPEGRSYAVKLTEKFFSYFDVAGGKDIREVFKNIKVPTKVAAQQTLGDLEVIDVGHRMEAINKVEDVPQEFTAKPPIGPMDRTAHNQFLDELDAKIEALSKRNNDNDADESLKRKPLPGMEETTEEDEIAKDT